MEGSPAPDDAPIIRVDGLRKTFGSGADAVAAVDDVSFSIDRGEVVGLLGPNGAGKTTTIKSMLGLIIPDAGSVEVAGIDVHAAPDRAYEHIGAMLEGARNVYWRLTPRENLTFFAGIGGRDPRELRDHHDAILDQFGLLEYADTPVNDLSRGMKQKVSLASTLARGVEVVFMDEPTLGLDIETSLELRAELRHLAETEGVTIVLSSHDMNVIEAVCDRVIVMQRGRIIANEAVDALIDLFRTRTYRVVTDVPVPDPVRSRLTSRFDAAITVNGAGETVQITAAEGEDIVAMIEEINGDGVSIRSIDSSEPSLEDIFLHLTSEDTQYHSPADAHASATTDQHRPTTRG